VIARLKAGLAPSVWQPTPSALNLVVPILRDRCSSVYIHIILGMLVERCVLTVINEDYYYYYYLHSRSFLFILETQQSTTQRGCSGLVTTCLTAVFEILGSNRTVPVGSLCVKKNHCNIEHGA